jgi:RNA polymerase sigma-70 factor (ECF subfamily)
MATDPPIEFEEFYLATRDRCFRAVLATVRDGHEADDLLAEAYTRALANWLAVAEHPAPSAWVVRTALNLHRDRWRRTRRLRAAPPAAAAPAPFVADIDPSVLECLSRLTARQRDVVVHRVLLGLSANDTARELDIDPGTVGTHLRRGLAALRGMLPPPVASPNDTQEIHR